VWAFFQTMGRPAHRPPIPGSIARYIARQHVLVALASGEESFYPSNFFKIIETILHWKNLKKSKYQFVIYISQKRIKNHLQSPKNLTEKPFLMF
jgi:hypothetical protein